MERSPIASSGQQRGKAKQVNSFSATAALVLFPLVCFFSSSAGEGQDLPLLPSKPGLQSCPKVDFVFSLVEEINMFFCAGINWN